MQLLISLTAKTAAHSQRKLQFIITPSRLRFRPMVLYFWAYLVDNGKESSEKYQVIVPRAAGSDLPDRRRIEHAVASHVRVID
jgi:uncharacterized membrane-anchored protein